MTVAVGKLTTAEELLAMGGIGRCELIHGEIARMSPTGFLHGVITMNVAAALREFVKPRGLGLVLAAETGFAVERRPDTVLAPDVAFIVAARVVQTTGFFEGVPDLAVEVMSPSDTWSAVNEKVDTWLEGECRSCWVVDPKTRTVTIYHADRSVARVGLGENLTDESILPGFSVSVESVFAI